jgi:PIN domain nuclease of toxin-antitoxin system
VKLLLDTHAVVWWWLDDPRLPAPARAAIAAPDNTVCVSAASAWEFATKNRLGKWPDAVQIVADFPDLLRRSRFCRSRFRSSMRVWPVRYPDRTEIRLMAC